MCFLAAIATRSASWSRRDSTLNLSLSVCARRARLTRRHPGLEGSARVESHRTRRELACALRRVSAFPPLQGRSARMRCVGGLSRWRQRNALEVRAASAYSGALRVAAPIRLALNAEPPPKALMGAAAGGCPGQSHWIFLHRGAEQSLHGPHRLGSARDSPWRLRCHRAGWSNRPRIS